MEDMEDVEEKHKVSVLFFASLKEAVGRDSMELLLETPATLESLMKQLARELDSSAMAALGAESVRVALNQELVNGSVLVSDGDEIAFLPPVTGG